LPRLPKQNFFKRLTELLSILSARLKAVFSTLLSVEIGELHLVKNVKLKNVAMIIREYLKACMQRRQLAAGLGSVFRLPRPLSLVNKTKLIYNKNILLKRRTNDADSELVIKNFILPTA